MARKVGRPEGSSPACTAAVTKRVAKLIEEGNYVEVAAAAAGISKQSVMKWLKLGSRGLRKRDLGENVDTESLPYLNFADSILKAMSGSQSELLAIVRKAAENGQWQAAAWMLERRHPKHWGRKDYLRMESYSTEKVIIEERRGFARDIFQDEDATEAALLLAERVARRKVETITAPRGGDDDDGSDDDSGGDV